MHKWFFIGITGAEGYYGLGIIHEGAIIKAGKIFWGYEGVQGESAIVEINRGTAHMKERRGYTERRQHERANVLNLVVGILNADSPESIGSIADISMGGVRFTNNELRMAPDNRFISSIDLIADDYYLINLPCRYAWNVKLETGSDSKLTGLHQSGIQFGRLTPNQTFLLRSLINHCSSLGVRGIAAKVHMT